MLIFFDKKARNVYNTILVNYAYQDRTVLISIKASMNKYHYSTSCY